MYDCGFKTRKGKKKDGIERTRGRKRVEREGYSFKAVGFEKKQVEKQKAM